MKTNTKRQATRLQTHEGGRASHTNVINQLRRSLLSTMLFEGTFYEDGEDIATRITELSKQVDTATLAALANEARSEHNLRHAPMLLLLGLIERGGTGVAQAIFSTIQRPDEMAELLALYWRNGRRPLAVQLRKGLRRAFIKFDRYQLAKYKGEGNKITLRDVMRLVRPKPVSEEQALLFKELSEGTLKRHGTWEDRLSSGENKREVFTDLIKRGRLGYLALLRNLRGMVEAGVSLDMIEQAILDRKGAERVLPFRFVAAAAHAPQFASSLSDAMVARIAEGPRLDGTTLILVDDSGSMNQGLSGKSDMTRFQAAAALAAMVNGRKRVFAFSQTVREVPNYSGLALVDALTNSAEWSGTYLRGALNVIQQHPHDRIIVITDEQSHDGVADPVVDKAYMINVAPYRNGVGYQKWKKLDGFSEHVLRWLTEFERLD